MTLHYLPTATTAEGHGPDPAQTLPFALTVFVESADEPGEREPWQGEAEALADAAAVGRRAAEWIRALPLPLPGGAWICGPLADAVEEAMAALDPADCDDADRSGHGGVSESARQRLDGLVHDVAAMAPLTTAQKTALFAVVHCAQGIPKALANDPGTVIGADLAAVCEIIRGVLDGAA